jgi:hypothetical protein
MQKRVFDRFGMTRSSLTSAHDSENDTAQGYSMVGDPIVYDRKALPRAASSLLRVSVPLPPKVAVRKT